MKKITIIRVFKSYKRFTSKFRDIKIRKIHRLHREKFQNEYNKIDEILDCYHAAGGLKHEFQAYKLFSLKRILEEKKPKSILELGTGSSTPIFSHYVRKSGDRCLTAIDENEQWLHNSMLLANVEKNDKQFNFILSKKKFNKDKSPQESKYNISLLDHYDLVFIDGPSLNCNGIKYKDAINSNIFDLAHPKIIIVDIRKATVNEIKKRMKSLYHCIDSDVILGNLTNNYNYFTEFYLFDKDKR